LAYKENSIMSVETRLCDTASMVVVHRVFRREFRLLHQMVGAVGPADVDRSAIVAKHLTEMVTALHHHHTGEDELLWPLLLERAALPGELLDRMERQHESIGELLDSVAALVPGWATRADQSSRDILVGLLEQVSAGLAEHLDDEESQVLPVVERHITEQEWDRLAQRGMNGMSKPRLLVFLGYSLEEASAEERLRFLAKVPPPARLAYRVVGHRRYLRESARLRQGVAA
jgi:hemerythrin-like domain-containing protein